MGLEIEELVAGSEAPVLMTGDRGRLGFVELSNLAEPEVHRTK